MSDAFPTVNPLTYKTHLRWIEAVSSKSALLVWNLFQKWAAVNGCIPDGRVEWETQGDNAYVGMTVTVILKERLGPTRDRNPLS